MNEIKSESRQIRNSRIQGLRDDIDRKFNARARRLGLPEIQVVIEREEPFKIEMRDRDNRIVRDEHGQPRYSFIPASWVHLSGQNPILPGGWKFVAALQHVKNASGWETIIRNAPEAPEAPAQYRACAPDCDHCHSIRNRHDTYLLVNEAGDWKQVGSSCLEAFLPGVDPERYLWLAEMNISLGSFASDDDVENGPREEIMVSLEWFLSVACGVLRQWGWISRKKAEESAMAGRRIPTSKFRVEERLFPPRFGSQQWSEEIHGWEVSDQDRARAAEVLAWAKSYYAGLSNPSQFDHNMKVLAGMERLGLRDFGLAAYLPQAYNVAMGKRIEHERAAKSEWQGEVGKRLRGLSLKVVRVFSSESMYGEIHRVKMVDAAGNRWQWKNSSWCPEPGVEVVLDGTVKEHSEWQGIRETMLSRCNIKQEQGPRCPSDQQEAK